MHNIVFEYFVIPVLNANYSPNYEIAQNSIKLNILLILQQVSKIKLPFALK